MSVRPIAFDPSGGITVGHDDLGHAGAVAFVDVRFARNPDGSVNADVLELTCPQAGCGAVSTHPIGGGCDAPRIQVLFARIWLRRAVALAIPVAERNWAGIKARVKARVVALEGEGRWRLEALQSEDDVPAE